MSHLPSQGLGGDIMVDKQAFIGIISFSLQFFALPAVANCDPEFLGTRFVVVEIKTKDSKF